MTLFHYFTSNAARAIYHPFHNLLITSAFAPLWRRISCAWFVCLSMIVNVAARSAANGLQSVIPKAVTFGVSFL